ncbi:MAG: hypothetical protein IE931_13460 [Sphingobacteriales bacterium]|nr:hypothetical protein [Sphingobacteriales bacterium]
MAALFHAINSLATVPKTAILLQKIEGHPQKEVAEMMNTNRYAAFITAL